MTSAPAIPPTHPVPDPLDGSTLSTSDEIAALAQGLRNSAQLPMRIAASIEALRRTGFELIQASVFLQSEDGPYHHCVLLPAPVTWERAAVPTETALDGAREAVARHASAPAKVIKVAVGADAIVLCHTAPGSLSERTLRTCATHLTALIRRAQDLRELEEARSQLGKLDEGLIALHEGSLDLSGEDETEVAGKIVTVALEKLGFDRAGTFLVDEQRQQLRGCVGVDELGRVTSIQSTVFPLYPEDATDLAEAAEIARGDLPYFVTQDLDGEGRNSVEGNIEASAAVPMRIGNRTVGVLAVDNYHSHRPILLEDLPKLMIVANHGAGAIASVRLQGALRRARDELEERVRDRTAELGRTNSQLQIAIQNGREARAAEQQTLRRQQHLLATNPAVIYSCRAESGFPLTFVSDNVQSLIGVASKALLADPELWAARIHPDDQPKFYAHTAQLIPAGQMSLEYRVRNQDGAWHWIHDEMRIVRTSGVGRPEHVEIIGSWLEITTRRQAEADRQQALEQLESQKTLAMRSDRLRSLGEMAAGIAHELNQPLAGVRGIAEHILLAISRDWDLPKEKIKERAEKIVAQADRMIHIIEHVRVFAREAGKPEMSAVDVNDVVRAAMDMHGVQFRSWGIDMQSRLQDNLPNIQANGFSLEEVLLNLLANARDAVLERMADLSDYSGGRVEVHTELTETGTIRVEVVDNGVGVPVGDQERVFEPFYTSKGPDKGTGLGLSISRTIVEQIDGRIWLEAAPGGGTKAILILPVAATKVVPKR